VPFCFRKSAGVNSEMDRIPLLKGEGGAKHRVFSVPLTRRPFSGWAPSPFRRGIIPQREFREAATRILR
jgi:hypothetical protein